MGDGKGGGKCEFYTDDHVAASLSRCSTHGTNPISCAKRLQSQNEVMLEALKLIATPSGLSDADICRRNWEMAQEALNKVSELK